MELELRLDKPREELFASFKERGGVVELRETEMVSKSYGFGVLAEVDLDYIGAERGCNRFGCTCVNFEPDTCAFYII